MKLFEPTTLGRNTLKNRMAMAPMTRSRANANGVVGDLTVLYYTQRSSAGFIVTEAINISEQAKGNPFTPGLFRQDQVEAWKKVTQAAHEKGSVIFAQLWHTGRVGHSVDRNGELPVAPSAIGIPDQLHYTTKGMENYETPRALRIEEVKQIVKDYRQAALNAIAAGFDGVELHAANGYLPNQFLADSANHRTDEYGGSIANKSRFVLEVMEALVDAVGGDRVGIRLSPTVPYNGIYLDDPVAQFSHLISALDKIPLAYVHLMNSPFPRDKTPHYPEDVMETFGKLTRHKLIANGGYSKASGEMELKQGEADIISFGALFLANPDLPERFELDAPLNEADRATMFGGSEKGYTDYPFLAA